jgi:hypothetical protein
MPKAAIPDSVSNPQMIHSNRFCTGGSLSSSNTPALFFRSELAPVIGSLSRIDLGQLHLIQLERERIVRVRVGAAGPLSPATPQRDVACCILTNSVCGPQTCHDRPRRRGQACTWRRSALGNDDLQIFARGDHCAVVGLVRASEQGAEIDPQIVLPCLVESRERCQDWSVIGLQDL